MTGRKESNIEIKSQLKIYDKNLDELSPKQLEYLNLKEISDNTIKIQAQFWKVEQNVKISCLLYTSFLQFEKRQKII